MARIMWDSIGTRIYELGLDRGVLYVPEEDGVGWSGLISVSESSSGGEIKTYFYEGSTFANVETNETFKATIEAFTYPDIFNKCLGAVELQSGLYVTAQSRSSFGLSYRTLIKNDANSSDYKIHIIYNAKISPASRKQSTISDALEPDLFSWDFETTPEQITGRKPTAHFVIDTRNTPGSLIEELENILYGTDAFAPALPTVSDLLNMFESHAVLKVTDNGDGTFTVDGPSSAIVMLDAITFEITWPSAVYLSMDEYQISSF